jgi:hypothetical protein
MERGGERDSARAVALLWLALFSFVVAGAVTHLAHC